MSSIGDDGAVSDSPRTRDYFAEMYVAGVLADAGWDIYFPGVTGAST